MRVRVAVVAVEAGDGPARLALEGEAELFLEQDSLSSTIIRDR